MSRWHVTSVQIFLDGDMMNLILLHEVLDVDTGFIIGEQHFNFRLAKLSRYLFFAPWIERCASRGSSAEYLRNAFPLIQVVQITSQNLHQVLITSAEVT